MIGKVQGQYGTETLESVEVPTLEDVLQLITSSKTFVEGNDSRMYITPEWAIKKWTYYAPAIMYKYAEIMNLLARDIHTVNGRIIRVNPVLGCFDLGAEQGCISISQTVPGKNLHELQGPERLAEKLFLLHDVTTQLTEVAKLPSGILRVELVNTFELPDNSLMITDVCSDIFEIAKLV